MKTHFDIEQFIEAGSINNELDYERAMIADRKLRTLAKENPYFKSLRRKLRDLIEDYENRVWKDEKSVTWEQMQESDKAEKIAESERVFLQKRKVLIQRKLKEFSLTQAEFGLLLGHKSKTHMSELINGIKPFTLQDLIVISILFDIDVSFLVPRFLSDEKRTKIKTTITLLGKEKLKANELIF
ncbi:transcriptional regulator [Chitinophaga sp. sic0106]|uniref:transcriptional regulator n=1 Tax=Chitinophaga sp. sic0106 TaxID=2854785 RepID=UPI001C4403B8|nr:transcriptional regulator [Chitinophaga sp. sic0106]MBV7532999.1 transcriptional regulator [Chitinophaga sp. sic0106]